MRWTGSAGPCSSGTGCGSGCRRCPPGLALACVLVGGPQDGRWWYLDGADGPPAELLFAHAEPLEMASSYVPVTSPAQCPDVYRLVPQAPHSRGPWRYTHAA